MNLLETNSINIVTEAIGIINFECHAIDSKSNTVSLFCRYGGIEEYVNPSGHHYFKPKPISQTARMSFMHTGMHSGNSQSFIINTFTKILPSIIAVILFLILLGVGFLDNLLLWPYPGKRHFVPMSNASSVNVQKAAMNSLLTNFGTDWVKFTTHHVSNDETIARIAYRYGLSPVTLVSVNNLQRPDDIKQGSELVIPYRDGLRYNKINDETPKNAAKRLNIPLELVQILPDGNFFVSKNPGHEELPTSFRRDMFARPLEGRVLVPFGHSIDRLTGISWQSNGIEIEASIDTPIRAAQKGTVLRTGRHSSWGYYIILDHNNGWVSFYGYLSRIDVVSGELVESGYAIGTSGQSGTAHTPRLHFALFLNEEPVDPFGYLY